jgi:esterase FrsA
MSRMAYQWPLDPEDLFVERQRQMVNAGLPAADVAAVRSVVGGMWPDRPGGWVHEWSQLAARYADAGRHDLAFRAYGWARFPCLADDAKRVAFDHQREQYRLAAPGFGVGLDRRDVDVAHEGGRTAVPVPVHLLAPADLPRDPPVLLVSGGVDTWKMDLHGLFEVLAQRLRVRVLAFDIAGTGESAGPMTPGGGAELVRGLVAHARSLTAGPVAHLGISMGGHYSARSGLAGEVDAAVVLGGPVEAAFTRRGPRRFGMDGIVGNALGFDRPPTPDELGERLGPFSLRPLLDRSDNAPMLVVNGADDVHVPRHDTLVFQDRPATEVHLLPDTSHCASSKLPEAVALIVGWLQSTLHPGGRDA